MKRLHLRSNKTYKTVAVAAILFDYNNSECWVYHHKRQCLVKSGSDIPSCATQLFKIEQST